MTTLTMGKALNLALHDALESDNRVLIFGEDVGKNGGVFQVTRTQDFDSGMTFAGIGVDTNPKPLHVRIADIKDGTSNVILFTHSIAACGTGTGTIWGYGAGVNQPP